LIKNCIAIFGLRNSVKWLGRVGSGRVTGHSSAPKSGSGRVRVWEFVWVRSGRDHEKWPSSNRLRLRKVKQRVT